jgi:ATP-dependent DNA helicase UvrD/PcrA
MDDRIQALAAEAARQLLQNFRVSHPQWTDDSTPLNELASWLGLEIATFSTNEYPEGTYGFLEPGENLVWLCRNLPSGLQRFTLAHEIGHAILHRQLGHQYIPFLSSLPANLLIKEPRQKTRAGPKIFKKMRQG